MTAMTQPLRKAVCVLLAVWLAVALSGCMTSEDYELQHISETLSVDCPKERLMKKYDSHGGFLGDGTSFFVFSFEDDPQLQTIRDSGKWKPFPVSDNVRDILWSVGNPGDDDYSGPPLITKDGDERSLFPRHLWEKHRGLLELAGKNVLIVGCGSVGNECAKRFNAFGCKVTGIDLIPRVDSLYSEMSPLDKLDNALEGFKGGIAVIGLLVVAQFLVLDKARMLLLLVVALRAVGPALRIPADRPDVMGILGKQLGQLQNFGAKLHIGGIDGLWGVVVHGKISFVN